MGLCAVLAPVLHRRSQVIPEDHAMDSARFDSFTRALIDTRSRRGALGVLLSGAVGVLGLADASAHNPLKNCKNKSGKQKKACIKKAKKHNATHVVAVPPPAPVPPAGCPSGTKPCDGECIPTNQCCTAADCPALPNYRCCNGLCTDAKSQTGANCTQDPHCCSNYCREIGNFKETCAATCRGQQCHPSFAGCCRGYPCRLSADGRGDTYCGGCRDSGDFCVSDAGCCFSACTTHPGSTQGQCLSLAGGPCDKNIDCKSCGSYGTCTVTVEGSSRDICTGGTCGCPDECCSSAACGPGKYCEFNNHGLGGVCTDLVIEH